MAATDLSRHVSLKGHAYRYIRKADRLPTTDEARAQGMDAKVYIKLFNPTGAGTWYITGYDPETHLATGLVDLIEVESGDFYMPELEQLQLRFRLGIERDLYFSAKPLRQVYEAARAGR